MEVRLTKGLVFAVNKKAREEIFKIDRQKAMDKIKLKN